MVGQEDAEAMEQWGMHVWSRRTETDLQDPCRPSQVLPVDSSARDSGLSRMGSTLSRGSSGAPSVLMYNPSSRRWPTRWLGRLTGLARPLGDCLAFLLPIPTPQTRLLMQEDYPIILVTLNMLGLPPGLVESQGERRS